MDFKRLEIPTLDPKTSFPDLSAQLHQNQCGLLAFLQENYNQVTLSIETNYHDVFDVSARRIEYVSFLKQEYMGFFSKAVLHVTDETESRQLLRLITQYDYLFQVHDSISDLFNGKKIMNKEYVELGSDVLLLLRELSSDTLTLFDGINKSLSKGLAVSIDEDVRVLRHSLEKANRELLSLLPQAERRDVGALSNFVTYSRRLMDKLVNFSNLSSAQLRKPDNESLPELPPSQDPVIAPN